MVVKSFNFRSISDVYQQNLRFHTYITDLCRKLLSQRMTVVLFKNVLIL